MKNIYNKINELWLRCRKWGDINIFGYFITGMLKVVFYMLIGLIIIYSLFIVGPFKDKKPLQEPIVSDSTTTEINNCNVSGINMHGELYTYLPNHADNDPLFNYDSMSSENIVGSIKVANENPKIKAIVIEVESAGGSPIGGEEIATAVKNSEKPVVAFIRGLGASSSYWAISTASKIWASKNSNVGSIGITMSYLNSVEKNKKDGYTYEQLSSGKFKDSGSANMPLTTEEKTLFMRDINIMYGNFIEAIATNRNLSVDKVKSIADGSTVLGAKAKELGLIDEIGSYPEVEKYLTDKIGEKVEVCWE